MAKSKQVKSRRLYKLVVCEAAIIAYVAYFTALGLKWLDIIYSAHSAVTFFNVTIFTLSIVIINLSVGLYEGRLREPFRGIMRRIFVSVTLSFFALAIISNVLVSDLAPHPLYAPMAVPLIILALVIFRYFIHNTEAFYSRPKLLVLGTGVRASVIERRMRRDVDRANFSLVGFIPVAGDDKNDGIQNEKILNVALDDTFIDYIAENEIAEIVIACDQRRGTLPIRDLFTARLKGVQVSDLLDFMERETGQIVVDLMYPSWVINSNGFESQNYFRQTMDYWLNVTLAFILLFFTWPIMLITALVIYLDDGRRTGASVLYKQERVGKDGEPFNILKFRSMRPDAEKDGAKWASKEDSRVTSIGAFIRKYRIDELPQLINVIRGDMSFIGPRPERPEFVETLMKEVPYYAQRHNVKPGLAGWAQLNYPYGASVADSLEKLKFDLYYVKHQSLLLDILILIRTVEVVLFGKGR
ncbi:TIGR03013 family PEP-CTERM/XrtA system glycosyltransferase [Glaciecola sp. XM2]|uniref:TIGR03013 family XrtA/PEP-CTERM system glycosyltransferase n=1 Tax=Glaciecola sp. XM2 TaxID=1914931 RepID=UPI001BDDEBA4|nr:TIGR03013 family XrtA/PEP-CTERM system glycosyltransferase [Glaciecola sp. XM2]MBT1450636.1 TIGR03013 family PEP-CTERM/XrtA system glycosyltransferase [Glaciecola sp. XM2]